MTNKNNTPALISKINLKDYLAFGIIGIFASVIYVTSNFYFNEKDAELVTFIVSSSGSFAVFILCMITVKAKKFMRSIDSSFLFLGLGFLFIFAGEIAYWLLDMGEFETYPSIADVFFFIQYPMFVIFYLRILQIFITKQNKIRFIFTAVLIPTSVILTYLFLTISQTNNFGFDFWYGLLFISATSSTLGMTVSVVIVTKGGAINKIWIMILLGLLANSIGDVWYYYLESIESYDLLHPVNLFWYVAYATMIYAVYKQITFDIIIKKDKKQ